MKLYTADDGTVINLDHVLALNKVTSISLHTASGGMIPRQQYTIALMGTDQPIIIGPYDSKESADQCREKLIKALSGENAIPESSSPSPNAEVNSANNEQRVKKVIAECWAIDVNHVTLDKGLYRDFRADGFDIEELLMDLEDEFDTHIPPPRFDDYTITVADVIKYVKQHTA